MTPGGTAIPAFGTGVRLLGFVRNQMHVLIFVLGIARKHQPEGRARKRKQEKQAFCDTHKGLDGPSRKTFRPLDLKRRTES